MQITPWRPILEQALAAHAAPDAGLMQLATVRPDGAPANRTVVFRGWADIGDGLLFTADTRSEKIEQTRRQPLVALCWYLRETREQFRLSGCVRWIEDGEADATWKAQRLCVWSALSDATRQSFLWPAPGAPRAEGLLAMKYSAPAPDALTPPPSFALGVVEPDLVEHLAVGETPHRRTRYTRDKKGVWSVESLNP